MAEENEGMLTYSPCFNWLFHLLGLIGFSMCASPR